MAAPGTVTHVMEVAARLRAAADAHAASVREAAAAAPGGQEAAAAAPKSPAGQQGGTVSAKS